MNLANRVTMARIMLVPVFLIFMLQRIPYGNFIAAAIFILAASTDGLDGYIARKRQEITNLGKFLDPLADKLLITSALVTLVATRALPAWIAIIIISREFIITGFRSIAANQGVVVPASILGKLKTILQVVAIVALLLNNYPFNYINFPFSDIAIAMAVALTVWSGVDYMVRVGRQLHWN